MKNKLIALCFAFIAADAALLSAPAPRPAAKAPDTGWVSLFNGKDLTGWVNVGTEKWEVVDGAIYGKGQTDSYGYLRTEKRYIDFHLSLRFKCEADGNSGVFFHVEFEGETPKVTQGLQVEIDRVLGHHTGGIYGDGRKWVVWPAAENELVVRPNDWNEMLIKIEANRYIVRLNGITVVDFTDPTPLSFDGYVALQLHSGGKGEMRFKDIFIRDLSKR
ncbi:MAG: DUF1080 domain-containing protein [Opitutaceae bacterium]|nr:DUF1080 domain-containing protein [Opitutaceae bacterium]